MAHRPDDVNGIAVPARRCSGDRAATVRKRRERCENGARTVREQRDDSAAAAEAAAQAVGNGGNRSGRRPERRANIDPVIRLLERRSSADGATRATGRGVASPSGCPSCGAGCLTRTDDLSLTRRRGFRPSDSVATKHGRGLRADARNATRPQNPMWEPIWEPLRPESAPFWEWGQPSAIRPKPPGRYRRPTSRRTILAWITMRSTNAAPANCSPGSVSRHQQGSASGQRTT